MTSHPVKLYSLIYYPIIQDIDYFDWFKRCRHSQYNGCLLLLNMCILPQLTLTHKIDDDNSLIRPHSRSCEFIINGTSTTDPKVALYCLWLTELCKQLTNSALDIIVICGTADPPAPYSSCNALTLIIRASQNSCQLQNSIERTSSPTCPQVSV